LETRKYFESLPASLTNLIFTTAALFIEKTIRKDKRIHWLAGIYTGTLRQPSTIVDKSSNRIGFL